MCFENFLNITHEKRALTNEAMITATGSAAGIGFTVAIFIAHIAFDNRQTEEIAIIAVIIASLVSALLSLVMFRRFAKQK